MSALSAKKPMLLLAVLVVCVVLVASVLAMVRSSEQRALASSGPNIVVVMTDDQTVEQMAALPVVEELLSRQGTTFDTHLATYPLCCPSRASYLTGQYPHNHGVQSNHPPAGGYGQLRSDHTLPVWLHNAGYRTAHVGKYLNGYGRKRPRHVPPGWDEWYAGVGRSAYRYFGYRLNENGRIVRHGRRPAEYQTDVYTDRAVDFVRRQAPRRQPFYLDLAYLAPHSGAPFRRGDRCARSAQPAPRHRGSFRGLTLPRSPSFNEPDVSDKPGEVGTAQVLRPRQVHRIAHDYRCRRESLRAVDEGVRRLVESLRDSGELDRTLIAFTSDNGFFQGEHRIPKGKFKVYEPSVRVPLVLRGPGIPAGRHVAAPTANIDLPRTILDAAGVSPELGHRLDGRSLLPGTELARTSVDRAVLVENGPDDGPRHIQYDAVRTRRYTYVEYVSGERELYDLWRDPHQLGSVHQHPAYGRIRQLLAATLAELRTCVGPTCQRDVTLPDP